MCEGTESREPKLTPLSVGPGFQQRNLFCLSGSKVMFTQGVIYVGVSRLEDWKQTVRNAGTSKDPGE